MQIYPAILTNSIVEFEEQFHVALTLPDVQTVQVDIIDGEFADNLTITPADLAQFSTSELFLDFHLMVNQPDDYLTECFSIENTRAIIAQVEHLSHQAEFLTEIKKNERIPGLSLDLYTPVEAIEDESWQVLKIVQIMGIEAGFQGQTMKVELVIKKIQEIKSKIQALGLKDIEIIVDGGVNQETIASVISAGADNVAVGSALWKSADPSEVLQTLLSIVGS